MTPALHLPPSPLNSLPSAICHLPSPPGGRP